LEATDNTYEKFRVGDLEIDSGTFTLRRQGEEIALPKLSFELLLCLARHAPNVVGTETLMDEVWGQVVVGEETVKQRVKLLRKALGDSSSDPRYIAAVRGRGYRLLAEVSPLVDEAGVAADGPVKSRSFKSWMAPIALLAAFAVGFLLLKQNDSSSRFSCRTGAACTKLHRKSRGVGGLSERACRLSPLDPPGQRNRIGLL
jgi:DNA-binding winged helix-turn-helix (wHTH) protein